MKKTELTYLLLLVIGAELVIVFPIFFPRHATAPGASEEASARATRDTAAKPSRTMPARDVDAESDSESPTAVEVTSAPVHVHLAAAVPSVVERRFASVGSAVEFRATAKPIVPDATAPAPQAPAMRGASPHSAAPIATAPPQSVAAAKPPVPTAHAKDATRVALGLPIVHQTSSPTSRTAPAPASTQPIVPRIADAIFEFDATSTHLTRGQKTFLCVGLDAGVTASIAGVGRIAAGHTSCHRVAPQHSATYVLTVERNGVAVERSVSVVVTQQRAMPALRPTAQSSARPTAEPTAHPNLQPSTQPKRHRFDVPG